MKTIKPILYLLVSLAVCSSCRTMSDKSASSHVCSDSTLVHVVTSRTSQTIETIEPDTAQLAIYLDDAVSQSSYLVDTITSKGLRLTARYDKASSKLSIAAIAPKLVQHKTTSNTVQTLFEHRSSDEAIVKASNVTERYPWRDMILKLLLGLAAVWLVILITTSKKIIK